MAYSELSRTMSAVDELCGGVWPLDILVALWTLIMPLFSHAFYNMTRKGSRTALSLFILQQSPSNAVGDEDRHVTKNEILATLVRLANCN